MRWYILKTLLYKEALRHASNRGGLLLAGLLVTASLVMAAFNPGGDKNSQLIGGIQRCYIDVDAGIDESDEYGPWIKYLKSSVPATMTTRIHFREIGANVEPDSRILYETGTGAIQIRKSKSDSNGDPRVLVWLWHPAGDRIGMASYEDWFSRESYRYFHQLAAAQLEKKGIDVAAQFPSPDLDKDVLWQTRLVNQHMRQRVKELGGTLPDVEWLESPVLGSSLDMRAAIATALVMFALFFTCVYLMPSLTCEEHERGLLLAQALSPARVREILAAKFLFYPTFGVFLATLLAGIHNPAVLIRPFFWLSLLSLSLGSLGIGMSIASLARTQRSASLAALCYMLVVTLLLLICQHNNIAYIPYLAIEYHAPQILHATLTNQTQFHHWYNLLGCGILAIVWVLAAGFLFRKRGWQ